MQGELEVAQRRACRVLGQPRSTQRYTPRAPERNRLLADHLVSEYRVRTEGRGRKLDEWKPRAAGIDNHWLDCLVGCAVAASMGGAAPPGMQMAAPRRVKVPLWELKRRALAARG